MSKFKNLKELEGAYKELEEELADMERSKLAWENKYFKLEKQLAEKDRIIESLKPIHESVVQTCNNDAKEIDRLNGLLAKKEKEIENLKLCRCVNCTNEYEFMLEGLVEDLEKQIEKHNQDKFSFAVEQLRLLKEKGLHFLVQNTEKLSGFYVDIEEIDNQIKELEIEKIVEFYINTEDKNKELLLYVADEISSPFPNFKGKIKQTTLNKIMKDINANCKTKKEIE